MSSSGSKVVFQSSLATFMEQFVRERRAIGYRYEVLARMRACHAHAMKTPRVFPRDGEERACRLIFSFLVSIGFFKESIDLSETELRTLHGMLDATVHQLEVEAVS